MNLAPSPDAVLGIDAGGTYTDAALMTATDSAVVARGKAPTTWADLSLGIGGAARALGTDLGRVSRVSLSTTLATNTLVEGLGAGVGLLLLGHTQSAMERHGLHARLPDGPRAIVPGAMTVYGEPAEDLDEEAVRRAVARWSGTVGAVAVCGMFAIRNPAHELRAGEIVAEEAGCPVVCSHVLSGELNMITRATTCVLNARLLPVVKTLLDAVRPALEGEGAPRGVPLFLVRGDGTLMTEALARSRPLEVFFSGPASSAIGAAFLAGEDRAVVVDVGGTTSDVTLVEDGVVLLSPAGAVVGGLLTHVPGVHGNTLGLGGDSHLRLQPGGGFTLGPQRVAPVSLAVREHGLDPAEARGRLLWGHHGLPDYLVRGGPVLRAPSPREEALLAILDSRALSVESIAATLGLPSPTLLPMRRLLADRTLLPIGPTPTDVFAALGSIEHVDDATAGHVARSVARDLGCTVSELAPRVRERMADMLADAVARTCIARWNPRHAWNRGLDLTLDQPSQAGSFLRARAILTVPLLGVGAPAAAVVPLAAERLDARSVVPAWSEVGGAVGAAVARVRRVATVKVRPLYEAGGIVRFALYSRRAREVFIELDAALARAEELARELAFEDVRDAGRRSEETIEVSVERSESGATDGWGGSVWLETEVRAVARMVARSREGAVA